MFFSAGEKTHEQVQTTLRRTVNAATIKELTSAAGAMSIADPVRNSKEDWVSGEM